jgi:hypothetical protein
LDLGKYVSGALYPDTRYLSGLKRALTHDRVAFMGRTALTDFEKGWLSHILGDEIFQLVLEERFGDLILFEEPGERWPVVMALRILQDLEDFLSFDIQSVLPSLDYYELHFREDERRVVEYYRLVRQLYEAKPKLTVEDALSFQEKLGVPRGQLERLKKKIIELYQEEGVVEKIKGNFEEGMELYEEKYQKLLGMEKGK